MLLIGDVHGQIDAYWKLLQKHKPDKSIQLGDFGFSREHRWHMNNINPSRHKVIPGNHDHPKFFTEPHILNDFGLTEEGYMYIRGAWSIDHQFRTIGIDWWEEEQMSWTMLEMMIEFFEKAKPDVVLSHDCPLAAYQQLFHIQGQSRTCLALQEAFERHRPKLWVFGHHHQHRDETIYGTRFVCLEELELMEI